MTAGLRIRDAAGNVISDPSFSWGRVLAVADIPASSSGSYSIPNPGSDYGQPWRKVQPVSTAFIWSDTDLGPSFGGSGATVTYTNPHPYAFKVIHGIN